MRLFNKFLTLALTCSLLLQTGVITLAATASPSPSPSASSSQATETESPGLLTKAELKSMDAGEKISADRIDFENLSQYFSAYKIKKKDSVYQRIKGKSFKKNKLIKLKDLRYIKVLHYNYKHKIQVGEIIVNKKIAGKIKTILRKLFKKEYEIKSLYLIDNYWTNNSALDSDDASCDAGNSSGFCYRLMTGSSTKLSKHGMGMAVDINTRENPYVYRKNGKWVCNHKNAKKFINRKKKRAHMITKKDACYKLFKKAGATWGGSWHSIKDYQHFEF
ncbi:MAG: M15 family metallopeptidase [Eubacterium sp.]|nr:M15 family metallopeptidase [Eubacterium sp.]